MQYCIHNYDKSVHQGPHAQYRSKFTCALYFFNVRDRNKKNKKISKKKMKKKKIIGKMSVYDAKIRRRFGGSWKIEKRRINSK